ncbi:MAG TPA: alpha/beta hydrolase [Gemmatimonadaceae bacterium]|nr:alpha/beta hydrolase [Gemmatimonadaceae bacterium]
MPVGPGSLHVERYGHGGQAVLLVHGFGTCAFVWRNVGPEIALANLTAFAVDMFGYGESDRPFDADYGIAAQAEYLDRGLTALRVSKATVVGLDLGGTVALRFAAAHPERVEKLLLINPLALDAIPGDDVKSLQKNTGKYAFRVSRGVMGAAPLLRDLLKKSVADPANMPETLVARYLAPYVGREGVDHLLRIARFVDRDAMDEVDLRALPHPTMIIWGERDPWVSPKIGEQLADTIGGSRLVRLPSASRLVPEDNPEMLNNLLLEFLGARATVGTV